jgi:hypothetical protein
MIKFIDCCNLGRASLGQLGLKAGIGAGLLAFTAILIQDMLPKLLHRC